MDKETLKEIHSWCYAGFIAGWIGIAYFIGIVTGMLKGEVIYTLGYFLNLIFVITLAATSFFGLMWTKYQSGKIVS